MTQTDQERGVALVLALFLMSAMSVLAASLMFLSQTETYASMNYRMMSQARYAAESGVQKTANFLLDSAQYAVPGGGGDPLTAYVTTGSPVTYNGQAVTLSGVDAAASNYPVAAVKTAFFNAAHGTLSAGTASVSYNAVAKLVSMQQFDAYGGGQSVVQTWEITGTGALGGARNAAVQVVAIIETPKVPASSYATFATDPNCGAIEFQGNVTINSYDSSAVDPGTGNPYTTPQTTGSGGNVGTNGNLSIGGSVNVQGNLSTPRTGVGSCSANAVDALTESGNATVTGSIVQLPSAVAYPSPSVPSPATIAAQNISTTTSACSALGLTASSCTTSGDDIIIDGAGATLSMPSVSLTSHVNIVLVARSPAAQYNFNSISLAGGSSISIKATSAAQGVLVGIVGKDNSGAAIGTPIDFTGGTFAGANTCASCTAVPSISKYDASMLQFLYGGSGAINMKGNSAAAATFYAPNATVTFGGTDDLYGSVLGKKMIETGNGNIHYDRRLGHDFYVKGNPLASSFSWKKS